MDKDISKEYKPISMWGYFGYQILFNIPIIGWIILIVFALGGTNNINVRNYARAHFCYLILFAFIIVVISLFIGLDNIIANWK